ncbi:MAG: hypothetical protein WAX38_02270 [Minisyncoccia bacterium]
MSFTGEGTSPFTHEVPARIPFELESHKEVLGIKKDTIKFKAANRILEELAKSAETLLPPQVVRHVQARTASLSEYFTYPLMYVDVFANNHTARRAWRQSLAQNDPPAFTLYERQRIKNNERQRLGDMVFLIMLFSSQSEQATSLLNEANEFQDSLLTAEAYGQLTSDEKIAYVDEFDRNIVRYIKGLGVCVGLKIET